MRLVTSVLLALVLASPAGALAAVGYRCGGDTQVRASCCCPDDKGASAAEEAAACPEIGRPDCCETVAQAGATVPTRSLIQALRIVAPLPATTRAAEPPAPARHLAIDAARPDLPPGRASPAFLQNCSLLL